MELATDQSSNLSEHNVSRRLRGGIVILMFALAVAVLLQAYDVGRVYRLALFPLFFLAENAFFQAIHKTCGFSAIRGVRHTAEGDERIADPAALQAARQKGRQQIVHSLASACVLTAIFVWIGP